MWGSFYLGSVLNCDCILQLFLGDISSSQDRSPRAAKPAAGSEINLPELSARKDVPSATKLLVDRSVISPKIIFGIIFCVFATAHQFLLEQATGTLSGEGRVYGAIPISQNKLYFELHILAPGEIKVGISCKEPTENTKEKLLESLNNAKTWAAEFGPAGTIIETGDIIV